MRRCLAIRVRPLRFWGLLYALGAPVFGGFPPLLAPWDPQPWSPSAAGPASRARRSAIQRSRTMAADQPGVRSRFVDLSGCWIIGPVVVVRGTRSGQSLGGVRVARGRPGESVPGASAFRLCSAPPVPHAEGDGSCSPSSSCTTTHLDLQLPAPVRPRRKRLELPDLSTDSPPASSCGKCWFRTSRSTSRIDRCWAAQATLILVWRAFGSSSVRRERGSSSTAGGVLGRLPSSFAIAVVPQYNRICCKIHLRKCGCGGNVQCRAAVAPTARRIQHS